jgi:glycosyltransferase involved in cell wall biosynthesis
VIALDLSRLLSRAGYPTPTGIDRVEMAYARHLLSGAAAHCFTARHALGGIGLLPAPQTTDFIAGLATLWSDGAAPRELHRLTSLARRLRWAALFGGRALRTVLRGSGETAIYLLVSHQNLDRARPIARLKSASGARFLCLIHDLIPLDRPELTRPGQARRHQGRVATVAALADAAIANSTATRDALQARLGQSELPIAIAPLGVDLPNAASPPAAENPYFVSIGTIEARKNLGLLLDVWQRLARELGNGAPRLKLIGRRGLGGEQIANRLKSREGLVTEHTDLPDAEMTTLLSGARALLLPSLAEGFGLPVVEALALGVPVLCSGLPALKESGGGIPDYLDPADNAAWHRAILDYTGDSPRRQAQVARLAHWRPPCWSDHFTIVERLIANLG